MKPLCPGSPSLRLQFSPDPGAVVDDYYPVGVLIIVPVKHEFATAALDSNDTPGSVGRDLRVREPVIVGHRDAGLKRPWSEHVVHESMRLHLG